LIVGAGRATLFPMNRASDISAYDPFGDPVLGRQRDRSTRGGRRVAIAVFWSLAFLLIVGRIYQNDFGSPRQPGVELASR